MYPSSQETAYVPNCSFRGGTFKTGQKERENSAQLVTVTAQADLLVLWPQELYYWSK
jgi:hypothetical protein